MCIFLSWSEAIYPFPSSPPLPPLPSHPIAPKMNDKACHAIEENYKSFLIKFNYWGIILMPCFIYIQDETIRLQMNIIVHSISVNQILLKASLIFFRYVARDV